MTLLSSDIHFHRLIFFVIDTSMPIFSLMRSSSVFDYVSLRCHADLIRIRHFMPGHHCPHAPAAAAATPPLLP
jgi:hypothetical protein